LEELGATITDWDMGGKTITAVKDDKVVVLTVGDAFPTVNGQTIAINQSAVIINGRVLAPLKYIAEAFNVSAEYDAATITVTITS
ncbi:MAG: copper amine oxidase N-terminal domain-containing protein, partial [Oscillospiraceae bacterium]|nr:copper amine oxidase N-terminal domain-containing protein [Oscillospiraceae bacterium]